MGSWPWSCSANGWPASSLPGLEPLPVPGRSLVTPQHADRNACCSPAGRWGAGGMVVVGVVSGHPALALESRPLLSFLSQVRGESLGAMGKKSPCVCLEIIPQLKN